MNSRERVLSALEGRGYDRIPVKHEATPEVNRQLMDCFGLTNYEQLLRVLGDDFRYVEPVYRGPELRTFPDGSFEGYWGERYRYETYGEGACAGQYLESVYQPYGEVQSLAELDQSHFPKADWFDYSTIRQQCEALHGDFAVCFGTAGDLDFINSIGRARGQERVLMDLATEDPVFLALLDARFQFYYEMHERTLLAAGGLIDIIHVGEDLGNQIGPTMSMRTFERLFAPKFEAHFKMAHRYGARTMMHMCGCVEPFLSRLIEIGLDIQDVVQPVGQGMDIGDLKRKYGNRLCFCGSMCVQKLLPYGSSTAVAREVCRRLELFPKGGLILGPTHAVQPGTPLENILTMYRIAGSLAPRIDETVRAIKTEDTSSKVNLSKLF